MENNKFYQHRKDIQRISRGLGVDVDTACTMLAKEKGWVGWQGQLDEFKMFCRGYALAKYGPSTKHLDHDGDGDVDLADLFARK